MKKFVFISILMSLIFLAGCQEKPQPDERLEAYVKLWNDQEFAEMHSGYLSQSAKETYSEEEFSERAKDLYTDLEVKNLQVKFDKPEEEQEWDDQESATFPVEIKMTTLAGDIQYEKEVELVKETKEDQENWYLNWDPSLILPDLEQGDKVRIQTVPAERGDIKDREGIALAVNGQAYEIGVVPEKFDKANMQKVADLLETTPDYIEEQMNQSWVQPEHFVPLKKIPMTNRDLAVELTSITGVFNQKVEAREYPYGEATAHIIGYTGKITAEEYEELKDKGYSDQAVIGKRGLEELFEEKLRGTDGKVILIEKESGDAVTIATKEVKQGEDVKLTIDANLQKELYEQMKDETGTAAALNPNTGEVLSMISVPSFDPNEFALGISSTKYKALQDNPDQPLLNRVVNAYSPGSTMKPITAAIGLNSGKLDPAKAYTIEGKQWQKDESWGGYKVTRVFDNDTKVDLESALKFSDNIYFARAGLDMGADTFQQGLKNFGFGEDIPFAYPITASQITNEGEINKEILLADSAYGQGQILMSVLHLTSSYGAIINDGIMMKPLLIAGAEQEVWKNDLLSKENAELLKTDLRKVVTEGIAGKAAVEGKAIAGKTGTAEIKSEQGTTGTENGLFVSYDQDNPEFVLAMLLENVEDRGGSTHTVEVTKKFYQNW
ncbi:penicillin-binding transpeptidase domain-containing protein [Bacillus salacetis]|uniref:serine-type D-Ala-D-Ala carboxypeptidase n=1 Tax=Bacillus salacetis TaxID=2315464 RepID=A0A3A1R5Q2_9BACI|nr:penicillin-binding transpeptidase domain-containing protein [Bacillus salacetis]RIW36072.1 penicillin-binding transpeptidase domain-containing protein [Bacillus salacetis]